MCHCLVPGKFFQSSVLLVGLAWSLPQSESPERPASYKHSSLLGRFASYKGKEAL